MALAAGSRLGPYEIVSAIGAGGMGEVYKARDTRLERAVAIKVLPASLAADREFRERFDREAKSISALNHPNICTLFDVGTENGVEFLVMEFLEGETLASRLGRGPFDAAQGRPLSTSEALGIAIDIASALDKAHRQGIVHRDLKPGNVMLVKGATGQNRVQAKLLDFGLAKVGGGTLASGVTTLATMTSPAPATTGAPLTSQGTILGTFQYMAPEQVEGEPTDARADLFAFGAVLFEMLTGRKAFQGKSQASLLGAILKEEPPPVSQLQPMAPPALDRVVRACLAKDPNDRLQTAHDLLLQLQWILEGGSAAGVPAPVVAHRKQRERTAWYALAGVAALWLATLVPAVRYFEPAPEAPRVQFNVTTPDVPIIYSFVVAPSPDGRWVAFSAPQPGSTVPWLWVRALDDVQARMLPGTENAVSPFWAPDSRHLAFGGSGKLRTIDVTGGAPGVICDTSVIFAGGSWNADGVILFATGSAASTVSLERVSDKGGPVSEVVKGNPSLPQTSSYWPTFLPDKHHFLYLSWSSEPSKRAIFAGSLDGGTPSLVVSAESQPTFAAPHTLFYVRDGALLAQPFDPDRLSASGDATRITEGVMASRINGRSAVGASNTGMLAYRIGAVTDLVSDLAWFDRTGKALGTVGEPGTFNQLRLSPDERRVVVSATEARTSGYNMWTMELSNGILTQTTFEDSANDPLWKPDSQHLAFESLLKGKRDFFEQTLGTRTTTLLFESPEDPKWLDDWSRDGKFLLYHLPSPSKLFAVAVDGDHKPRLLAETPATFDGAHFSPDGKWVAYQTNESKTWEVWVAAFPAFDKRRRVSSHGGGQAFWHGDMKELFYLSPDGKMMSARIVSDPAKPDALEFQTPVALFQSPLSVPTMTIDQYSVTKDGQRFLFLQPRRDQAAATPPITVVVNWPSAAHR